MTENQINELAEEKYREFPQNPKSEPNWEYGRDIHVIKKRTAFIKGFKEAQKIFFTEEEIRKAMWLSTEWDQLGWSTYDEKNNSIIEKIKSERK